MNLRSYRTFQALVLALLAIFLLTRIGDGRILLYINRRYVFLAMGAALLLMVVAQAVLRGRGQTYPPHPLPSMEGGEENHTERKGWVLWLMALPLLIGVLIPARPLNAGAAAVRGLNTSAALTSQEGEAALSLSVPPEQRSVLDWIRVFSSAKDPAEFTGQPADVTGFVYHDVRLRAGEFMAGRFSVTCCVADAIAIGTLVEWPESASLPDNRWVRVRGNMTVGEVDGQKVPLIRAASVETVPEPEQPYIFP